MGARRVRSAVSDIREAVIAFAAKATNSVPHGKILFLAALAALFVAAAVPILSRANMSSAPVSSTLKCYDKVGNYEPCAARASASVSRLDGQAAESHRLPSWITTALYQEANSAAPADDQPENGTANAPAARRNATPRKHIASAACRRHLIPCFFSALRKGVTHIASAAANLGQPRPAREHL
jgi:hypothetical protein